MRVKDGKIINKKKKKSGYIRIGLNRCHYYKHRLIALAWIPNPDNLPMINHKDEDKANNRFDNFKNVFDSFCFILVRNQSLLHHFHRYFYFFIPLLTSSHIHLNLSLNFLSGFRLNNPPSVYIHFNFSYL